MHYAASKCGPVGDIGRKLAARQNLSIKGDQLGHRPSELLLASSSGGRLSSQLSVRGRQDRGVFGAS